jgi:adenosylhomocysteine nucleosidase
MVDPFWAIVIAVPHEAVSILNRMSVRAQTQFQGIKLFEGSLGKQNCILLQTGMGPIRAEKATRFLLDQFPITHLFSTGYCGALQKSMKTGDAVVADSLISNFSKEAGLFSDTALVEQAIGILEKLKIDYFQGPLVTSSKPILKEEEKEKLSRQTGAIAVDMESFAVVKTVAEAPKKIASLTVRFVVDALNDKFGDYGSFIDDFARVKPAGLVREIIRRPKVLLELTGFEKKAKQARSYLLKFVEQLFDLK